MVEESKEDLANNLATTDDVFGKSLDQFKGRLSDEQERPSADTTPLIFWLLSGYMRSKIANMQTLGIFRVTGSDPKIRELELHMSQGNYSFLESVKSQHTVTNYWKRVLR